MLLESCRTLSPEERQYLIQFYQSVNRRRSIHRRPARLHLSRAPTRPSSGSLCTTNTIEHLHEAFKRTIRRWPFGRTEGPLDLQSTASPSGRLEKSLSPGLIG